MKLKKIAAYAISAVMLLQALPVGAVTNAQNAANAESEAEETAATGREVYFDLDFEKGSEGLKTSGIGIDIEMSPNGTSALRIDDSKKGYKWLGKISDKALQPGRYRITYDFYSEAGTESALFLKNSATATLAAWSGYEIVRFRPQSTSVGGAHSASGWAADHRTFKDYEKSRWYNVDIWLDTENREMAYLLDGETIFYHKMDDATLADFKGISLWVASNSDERKYTYIDNFKFYKEAADSAEWLSPIAVEYELPDGVLANNFDLDTPVSFNLNIKNRTAEKQTGEMYYKIYDYITKEEVIDGTSEKETITLEPGESTTKKLTPKETIFGRFDLKIITRIGDREYEKPIPYTMINHSDSMPQNENCGVAAHFIKRHDPKIALPLAKQAGIKWIRSEAPHWYQYDPINGKYSLREEEQEFFDLINENNLSYLFLWMSGNAKLYPLPEGYKYSATWTSTGNPGILPTTKEGFDELENFVKQMVELSEGAIKAVEVHNEWHDPSMSGKYAYNRYDIYADLCRTVYKGVKAADPECYVLGIDENNWGLYQTDAIEGYLKEMNGEKCFDVVSLHAYGSDGATGNPFMSKQFQKDVRTLLGKYNQDPDVPYWFTENGPSEGVSRDKYEQGELAEKQASNIVRVLALNDAEHMSDVYFNYNFVEENDKYEISTGEAAFGILLGDSASMAEVMYLGKPSYVSFANYNAIAAGRKSMENLSIDDPDKFIYQMKTRDDEDVLILGTKTQNPITFNYDLGCDKVKVLDMYGNAKTVYGTNGKYSFTGLENEINYVIGHFNKVEECEPMFDLSRKSIDAPVNYEFEVNLKVPEGFKGDVKLELKNVDCEETLNDGKKAITGSGNTIKFITKDTMLDDAYVKFDVTDEKGNSCYTTGLIVNYCYSAEISDNKRWRPEEGKVELWNLKFDVKNIRDDKPISGTFTVKGRDEQFFLPEIAPGETREVVIPQKQMKDIAEVGVFQADLHLSTGEVININDDNGILAASYVDTAPKIDGVIEKGEYGSELLKFTMNQKEQVYGSPLKWNGIDDLSAEGYICYDENNNIYLGMRVKDDVHRQINEPANMWNGDDLQVLFVFDKGASGTQYSIAVPNGEENSVVFRHKQEGNDGGMNGTAEQYIFPDAESAVKRDGIYTTYEIRFPADKIRFRFDNQEKDVLKAGMVIAFSVCINDDDGANRKLWMEYGRKGSAIGSGNNTDKYATQLILLPKY